MTDRFTYLQMLKLVETYRDYPCLWNVTCDLYKNRDARESAYKEIWEKLDIPGLLIRDIPKKIKNMRSSYYQELKRIEKSTRSGAGQDSIYKPKVSWFVIADEFLRTFRNKQEIFSNIDQNLNTTSDNDSETQSLQNSHNDENTNTDTELRNTEKISSESNYIEKHQTEISSSEFIIPSTKSRHRKGKVHNKNEDIYVAIDRIDKIAKSVTNTTNSLIENKNKEDEFDIFGKYIAITLRSLPNELAIIAKTDIQKALSDIQLKALRQNASTAPISTSNGL